MNTRSKTVFETGFMLALLLATFAVFAQDAVDEELGPAVDTSAVLPEASEEEDAREAEIDALEPAVAAPLISDSVTRSTSGNQVMDQLELGRTEITGNQELPKVLYIVPWKSADPGDLLGRPVNSLLDEVLAPIDREEFVRQVDYHDDLYGDEQE